MNRKKIASKACVLALTAALATSCSVSKFLPEGATLLDKVSLYSDSASFKTTNLQGYIRQHPNNRWFSCVKAPLGIYCLSGTDSTKRINRFVRKLGEAPVIYDEQTALKTQYDLQAAVQHQGYLNATVRTITLTKGHKTHLFYEIDPGPCYKVRSLDCQIQDEGIAALLDSIDSKTLLYPGMDFNLNQLEAERSRLNSLLLNNGYYRFHKDFIHFQADTTVGNRQVDLKMELRPYRRNRLSQPQPHQIYRIGDVDFMQGDDPATPLCIRPKVLHAASELHKGDLYRETNVQNTYARMMRLGAVMSTNVKFTPEPYDSTLLHANISLLPSKVNSISLELEGTNSAGDLGAAILASYQNRNIFRGAELFSVKLRGAYEAIRGLNGYTDQDYIEYSAEMGITFPDFKFPFAGRQFRQRAQATTEVSLMYDSQDRPEFHRRVVTGALRYRWNRLNRSRQHKVDLLDLNYVFMPWISDTFRKLYLEDPDSKNAILRYNYENLFIMKWGYTFTYHSSPMNAANNNYGLNAYTLRAGIETAGNLLYGMSNLFSAGKNSQNQYTLFNIAYAEYVKLDFDLAKSFRIDNRNSFALHLGAGVAFPYGNSTILPYEKRYFSGGANSVRGWSVRELGPGTYNGSDGRIDFINQTGDIKLDMNAEYRTHLFWKIHGAVFVDAGNIWTLRSYEEQSGGQFRFDTFWRQIAVSYGLGLRLNFDYFILRLDGGMKAVHPAFTDSRRHFPIVHPQFNRDFSLHFAVGLPF